MAAGTPIAPRGGLGAAAGIQSTTSSRPGHHSWDVGGCRFDLPVYYQPVKLLGHGAYGVVM